MKFTLCFAFVFYALLGCGMEEETDFEAMHGDTGKEDVVEVKRKPYVPVSWSTNPEEEEDEPVVGGIPSPPVEDAKILLIDELRYFVGIFNVLSYIEYSVKVLSSNNQQLLDAWRLAYTMSRDVSVINGQMKMSSDFKKFETRELSLVQLTELHKLKKQYDNVEIYAIFHNYSIQYVQYVLDTFKDYLFKFIDECHKEESCGNRVEERYPFSGDYTFYSKTLDSDGKLAFSMFYEAVSVSGGERWVKLHWSAHFMMPHLSDRWSSVVGKSDYRRRDYYTCPCNDLSQCSITYYTGYDDHVLYKGYPVRSAPLLRIKQLCSPEQNHVDDFTFLRIIKKTTSITIPHE